MGFYLHEVRKAVYSKLDTDLSEAVYDDVPQGSWPETNQSDPYVVVSQAQSSEFDDTSDEGQFVQLQIDTWSRQRGMLQTEQLMSSIHGSLHDAALTLDSGTAVFVYHEFSETLLDPDGITRHGVMRFRVWVHD